MSHHCADHIVAGWLHLDHHPAAAGRLRFWVDIMALLPFDYVIIEAAFPPCFADNTARYWSLLKILRLVRCGSNLPMFSK